MFRVFYAVICRNNIYRNRQRGLIYSVHIVIFRFVDYGKIFLVRHTLPRTEHGKNPGQGNSSDLSRTPYLFDSALNERDIK